MEIKVAEIFEKYNEDLVQTNNELSRLILGKNIELYEYNEDSKDYDFIERYKILSVFLWEDEQLAFEFGPDEYDVCSINRTDLIKINEEGTL